MKILDENGQLNELSFSNKPVINNTTNTVDEDAFVGKFIKFEVKPTTGAIQRLNYYDSVASDNRCALFTIPGIDNDIHGVYIPYNDTDDEIYNICSSFNNGLLTNVNIQQTTEFGSFFIFKKECTDIKVMYLENLSTLVPVYDASDLNLSEK